MKKIFVLLLIITFKLTNIVLSKSIDDKQKLTFPNDEFRPQFHFSPIKKWMNDPNGLFFNDGIYHLYYQYYPEDVIWGPMHWGHAISEDLIYWKHQEVAIYPDSLGYIFSGSAVVDINNTSGFKEGDKNPIVAIYTYHNMDMERVGKLDYQTQGLAYSNDGGYKFKKYINNPIISNSGNKDFRDPKVFWHKETNKWILVLVAGDHIKIYSSNNLKDWEFLSEFGKGVGNHLGVWECPDLFPLEIEGKKEKKWVLTVSVNPGGPNGGSATQYFVGEFDGKYFITTQTNTKWLDYGKDNYAGVTYNNLPENERIMIGWMSNWQYATKTPTKEWRSSMTIPRKLQLKEINGDFLVLNYPIDNISKINSNIIKKNNIKTNNFDFKTDDKHMGQFMVDIEINSQKTDKFDIKISNDLNENIIFSFNLLENLIYFSRKNSGIINFNDDFAKKEQVAPIFNKKEILKIKILIDKSSVEMFLNEGETVMTNQFFPTKSYNNINISSQKEIEIIKIDINNLKSIWINK